MNVSKFLRKPFGSLHLHGSLAGTLWCSAGIAIASAILLFALLLAANFAVLGQNVTSMKSAVQDAFRSGQFVEDPYQEGSTTIGSHQWNDCLVTLMAVDQRGDPTRLALSPIIAGYERLGVAQSNPCLVLNYLSAGEPPDTSVYYYDRYLHGAVTILRFILPHFSVRKIRSLYRSILSALLIAGAGLAMIGLALEKNRAGFAVLAVCHFGLLRFFGMESFSQSLAHAPADFLLILFALIVTVSLFFQMSLLFLICLSAVFGSSTMIFELFTGGIPLGMAMVVGLTSTLNSDGRGSPVLSSFAAAFAFSVAAITTYILKVGAVAFFFEPAVLFDVTTKLGSYSALGSAGAGGGWLSSVVGSIGVMTGGMKMASAGMLLLALGAGAYSLRSLLVRPFGSEIKQRAMVLALSIVPVVAWFPLLSGHVDVHAWFMDRILVWLLIAGFGLYAMRLCCGRPAALNPALEAQRGGGVPQS